jgi:hypothetical protein
MATPMPETSSKSTKAGPWRPGQKGRTGNCLQASPSVLISF